MRRLILPLIAAFVLPAFEANAQSTTRIETRPFYGATVTLEEGVRVFRPLPAHDRVIINPGGATPLNLGITEERSVSHNYNYHYDRGTRTSEPTYVTGGVPVYVGKSHHRGHRGGGKH